MPDFTARFATGVTTKDWRDPATEDAASRINSRLGFPQKRVVGTVGVEVQIWMKIGTAEKPLDSAKAVGLRKFTAVVVDGPSHLVEGVTGQSSVQRFIPTRAGHCHIRVSRPMGGSIHLKLDIEEP